MTLPTPDSYELGGIERVRQRQEFVRLYYRLGIKETEIISRMQENGYIPALWEFKKKQSLIKRDLKKVKKEDIEQYQRLIAEPDGALVDYIGKLKALFEKTYEDGNWSLCRDLAKDLARAHGVPTEEPIRIEGDILTQMQAAFQVGMKRISEQKTLPPPPAIEVSSS